MESEAHQLGYECGFVRIGNSMIVLEETKLENIFRFEIWL